MKFTKFDVAMANTFSERFRLAKLAGLSEVKDLSLRLDPSKPAYIVRVK
tara:strand:- start:109 stop:255 length:147 start_codon:yes stop_codon:yes gene_type:complete